MLFTLLTWMVHVSMGQHVVISEVMPGSPDRSGWLELFNPGSRTRYLDGWSLVVQDPEVGSTRTFRFPEGLAIGPRQYLLLQRSANKLPRIPPTGSVLLVEANRSSVRDIFTWPRLPDGVTVCRCTSVAEVFSFSIAPTPGRASDPAACRERLLAAPEISTTDSGMISAVDADAELRYTTDGSQPTEESPLFNAAYRPGAKGMITLRAFAPDAVPSVCASVCMGNESSERTIALRIAPSDLIDGPLGMLDGRRSRQGKGNHRRMEVAAEVITMDGPRQRSERGRISLAGSGTRGLPKKSFKLRRLRPENDPLLGGWPEVMLRADASPNAFLHNLFMEHAMKAGAHVDVQPSLPVMVMLNGADEGLYRSMPAKNSDWLMGLCGEEEVDIVDGPAANAVRGKDGSFLTLLAALEGGSPLDTLERLMDVRSLLDLACADLWTGRADHDLNMRAWRPRTRNGRWRFILFDMDLWAPPDEHTIDRMCSETAPVSPWLPWLFGHAAMRDALLARMSAWLATTFAPDEARHLADSLFQANEPLMRTDHTRWSDTLTMVAPDEAVRSVLDHIANRTRPLLDQIVRKSGRRFRSADVSVVPVGAGWIEVEGLPARSSSINVPVFHGAPVHLEVHPAEGYEFVEWQGARGAGSALVLDGVQRRAKAVFRPVGRTRR